MKTHLILGASGLPGYSLISQAKSVICWMCAFDAFRFHEFSAQDLKLQLMFIGVAFISSSTARSNFHWFCRKGVKYRIRFQMISIRKSDYHRDPFYFNSLKEFIFYGIILVLFHFYTLFGNYFLFSHFGATESLGTLELELPRLRSLFIKTWKMVNF